MLPENRLKFAPWVVGLGLFIENIDVTVINTSLPEIARSISADPLDLKIGITSYLLTLAMLIPISGYIADRIGTKKTFSLAICIFMLGSFICGFANSLTSIIIGRLIQGTGGAIMTPVGRLILVKMFPQSKFVQAFSYVVIIGQIGTVIGPVIGGLITNYIDWRFIFFINIPIGIIALILVDFFITNIKTTDISPFDVVGFLIFGVATSLMILPLTLITQRTAVNPLEYCLLLIGFFFFVLYYFYSKKVAYPIIDLSLFRVRTYRLASFGNMLSRSAVGGIPFILPLLFQLNFNLSALYASLFLLPYGIGFLSVKFIMKMLLNRYGFRKVLIVNTCGISGMLFIFSAIDSHINMVVLDIIIFILGAMSSLQFSCLSILNYVDVERNKLSKATSLSSVIQQLSLGVGVCIVAGALIFFDSENVNDNYIPLEAFKYTFWILSGLMIFAFLIFARLSHDDGNQVLKKTQ